MSRYVDEFSIRDQAEELVSLLEKVEQALTNFQSDLDTNRPVREELKWDVDYLEKSLNDALFNARSLAEDAKQIAEGYDEDEDDDGDD